jgi:hypothetical protein
MSMDYLDALTYYNISENGEEGENGGECGLAIDDEKGDVVDLEAVCKVPYTSSTGIGMGDDNDLVAAINEFLQRGQGRPRRCQCLWSISRWTAGTCDSLLLLHLIRQRHIRSKYGAYQAVGRSCR